ncbi:2-hydroxycarboxylate transporter family protein [Endozoicomonas sp. 8E]|uniref:2-hydroxycarboxylate transporter family protein n=1 Tax=Endozoicomonas sp. 8E TaxID=3035692 RepID=UPI002938EAB2|nr:2-hydroxycarboxylate transporter family protein [Endozoicomonas sp. 8E]WOG30014.1 2-hydroxycarboxylate transporter family protein [Endozoicomonas sp. 8E]
MLFWQSLPGVVVIAAGCTGHLPTGMVGLIPFIMALGALLNIIGERLSWIRNYLGGGPVVIIFGSSLMVATGGIPAEVSESVSDFVRNQGFLTLFISGLITGSLFGMDRQLLLRSALRYLPVIVGGVLGAITLVGLAGMLIGTGFVEAVFYVGLPIMGGGMGAGAVPLAEIFANILNSDATTVLSKMVPAVVLGNLVAIIAAGFLERLGKIRPGLTGNGKLMKSQKAICHKERHEDKVERIPDLAKIGTGLFVATSFYVLANLLSLFISLHPYALMIFCVGLVKALGVFPSSVEEGAALWGNFMVMSLTPALLACIGIGFTDLHQIAQVISLQYFILVLTTVTGAILGAGLAGKILGFYPIEASVTAGLCMANMGGTGDVAVLSASRRMYLMPYAQVSSRIGGAFILLSANALVWLM